MTRSLPSTEQLHADVRMILHDLLDRYEKSQAYREPGSSGRRPFFYVTEQNLPRYFDSRTAEHRLAANRQLTRLKDEGIVELYWMPAQDGTLLEKLALNIPVERVVYKLLNREPLGSKEEKLRKMLDAYLGEADGTRGTAWLQTCQVDVTERLEEGRGIKRYLPLDDLDTAEQVLRVLSALPQVEGEIPKRVFSAKVLGDSKALSRIEKYIIAVLRDFHPELQADQALQSEDVLAEVGIIGNPRHIYIAGPVRFTYRGQSIDLSHFEPDVGLPVHMVGDVTDVELGAGTIITVENLTSFYQLVYQGQKFQRGARENQLTGLPFIAAYLGGYHGPARREILIRLANGVVTESYGENPKPRFYHWGDIDYGGFSIFVHLVRGTGIDLNPLLMNVSTLKRHLDSAVSTTETYARQLEDCLDDDAYEPFHDLIRVMLSERVRLEQEQVAVSNWNIIEVTETSAWGGGNIDD